MLIEIFQRANQEKYNQVIHAVKAELFDIIYIGQRLCLILGYMQGHSWLLENSNPNVICKIIWFGKMQKKHILNCHVVFISNPLTSLKINIKTYPTSAVIYLF